MTRAVNRKSASILPPGIMERAEYQRVRADEIAALKDEIKSGLEESSQAAANGFDFYAVTLEHHACVVMRRLIDLGAF